MSGYFATSRGSSRTPTPRAPSRRRWRRAQAYADANPASKAILPTYTKITSEAAAKVALNTYPSTLDAAPCSGSSR